MKRGYTLVEILVVLGILGVLAGLVLGVLAPARERARITVCTSNMHQIGKAFAMYIADYDGLEPEVGVRMKPYQLGLPYLARPILDRAPILESGIGHCPSYHEVRDPGTSTRLTYALPGVTMEDSDDWVVARQGPRLALVLCLQHNDDVDFIHMPEDSSVAVYALRINQQLQRVVVRPQTYYKLW